MERIKYIKLNEHDFIYARNLAFLSATGEYIALIDSDDKCSPNKLEEQIKFLDEHPDIDVVGCKIQFGAKTSNLSIPKTFNSWKDEYFKNELENNNENISMLLHFPSIMIRKETIHRIFKNNMYFYIKMALLVEWLRNKNDMEEQDIRRILRMIFQEENINQQGKTVR